MQDSGKSADVLPIVIDNVSGEQTRNRPKKSHQTREQLRIGHRQRLRERFLDQLGGGVADYELLELLLTGAIPRGDVRVLAQNLVGEFGGLGEVFAAAPERLKRVQGLGPAGIAMLKAVNEAGRRVVSGNLKGRHVLGNWQQIIAYCRFHFRHETIENCYGIMLDRGNRVICSTQLSVGTIDRVPIYIREVVRVFLNEGAASAILVHNHPSGKAEPSQADLRITRELIRALHYVEIAFHDHIIITRDDSFSFRNAGLLEI